MPEVPSPWQWWDAATIARVTSCPQSAVESNWPLIAASLDARGLWERDIARGVLSTVAIETASTFLPIHEYKNADGTIPDRWFTYDGGPAYHGRGFVQLTHRCGYRAAGQALGLDLEWQPDLALDPQTAADILAWFWATKTIPEKNGPRTWTLAQLCRERDWEWVRKAVQGGTNGLDRLLQIVNDLGDESTVAQLRVTEDGVRLRERPDTSAAILYEAHAGETFTPTTDHAWRQGTVGGRTGWMAAEYLEPSTGNSPSTPENSGALHFDPNTPTYLQKADFTCSIGSVIWMLRSLGMAVEPEDAYDAMVPAYVNSDVGLLDASGAGIVRVLADRWGVGAYNDADASFDEVAAVAGRMPVALGLRNWGQPGGHWSAVRGFDGERLVLANPAGTGPIYGQQTLTREQFDARAPASMVVVPIGG